MGKKSPPPAPDYRGAAQEQSAASQEIATQQNYADRPTVTTPWGTQTWTPSETIDPSTGKKVTQWNQNVSLDPKQQQALDAQMRLGLGRTEAAEGLLGQAVSGFDKPMDWSQLPSRAGQINSPTLQGGDINPDVVNKTFSFGGDSAIGNRQRAEDAVRQLQAPGLKQRREGAENQLVNQGFAKGSEAYTNAMRDVSDSESRADLMAIAAGRDEAEYGLREQNQGFQQSALGDQFENTSQQQEFDNMFRLAQQGDTRAQQQLQMQMAAGGFNNQNRSQAISEEQLRRGMSLNELNALLTGQQVNMPGMPQGANAAKGGQAADLLGAMGMQGQSDMARYNADMQQQGQTNSAIGSAAAMAAMYFF